MKNINKNNYTQYIDKYRVNDDLVKSEPLNTLKLIELMTPREKEKWISWMSFKQTNDLFRLLINKELIFMENIHLFKNKKLNDENLIYIKNHYNILLNDVKHISELHLLINYCDIFMNYKENVFLAEIINNIINFDDRTVHNGNIHLMIRNKPSFLIEYSKNNKIPYVGRGFDVNSNLHALYQSYTRYPELVDLSLVRSKIVGNYKESNYIYDCFLPVLMNDNKKDLFIIAFMINRHINNTMYSKPLNSHFGKKQLNCLIDKIKEIAKLLDVDIHPVSDKSIDLVMSIIKDKKIEFNDIELDL